MKNERSAAKNIALALVRGKDASEFSSWERDYLNRICSKDCTALAYNNYCYVVTSEGVCVTMFALPVWFGKKKRFDGKEHIRHCKKYQRNHRSYDYEDLMDESNMDSLEDSYDESWEEEWDDEWELLYEERA